LGLRFTVRKYTKPRITRNEGKLPMRKLGCIIAVEILQVSAILSIEF
jgi:hypothetical protein